MENQTLSNGELVLPADPIVGLGDWLQAARDAGLSEPNSMTLATATKQGVPHARIVLFKGFSESRGQQGLEFYTNYTSAKAHDLDENARAALVFHWASLRRQIRVEGTVEKLSAEESDRYFQTRARESRLGAWSSPQSRTLKSRDELVDLLKKTEVKYGEGPIPCPPFWGGWRVLPTRIEFWEERPHRLHERFEFLFANGSWQKNRLAP